MRQGLASMVAVLVLTGCSSTIQGSPTAAIGVMPDIIGMSEADAMKVLFDAGPWPYILRSVPTEDVAVDRVITAYPPAGTRLPLTSIVDVALARAG